MFEVQTRLPVRFPCSRSLADPANATDVPCWNELPLAGAVIVTVGAVFAAPLHAAGLVKSSVTLKGALGCRQR